MNSGNFGKHGINLHALELALRSKWRRRGRGAVVVGVPPKNLCVSRIEISLCCVSTSIFIMIRRAGWGGVGGEQN